MKLRNKKTGEIINNNGINFVEGNYKSYNSLAELNAEWEDYEEQKEWYWFIEDNGIIQRSCHYEDLHPALDKARKAIGNYFEAKEEAELAVRKLKAWKRLKDNGFRVIDWELDMETIADGKIWFDVGVNTQWDAEQLLKQKPEVKEALDVLFGGEE